MTKRLSIKELEDLGLDENPNKDMLEAIERLTVSVSSKNNEDIIRVLDKNNELVQEMVKRIKLLYAKPSPEINVETNQEQVVTSLQGLSLTINKNLLDLKKEVELSNKSEGYHPEELVISAIMNMSKDINNNLMTLKRPTRWEFDIVRGELNYIKTVIAKAV